MEINCRSYGADLATHDCLDPINWNRTDSVEVTVADGSSNATVQVSKIVIRECVEVPASVWFVPRCTGKYIGTDDKTVARICADVTDLAPG